MKARLIQDGDFIRIYVGDKMELKAYHISEEKQAFDDFDKKVKKLRKFRRYIIERLIKEGRVKLLKEVDL